MKNKLLISISALLCSVVLLGFMKFSPSSDGTPAGYSSSPSDGKDCASCHKAKPRPMDGIITTNISGNKYVPGKTYTITATLKGDAKAKKFGFQISPQNNKGKLMGKMVVTNNIETKLAGNGKYMNQITKGVDGNGSKTWTFDWIAPEKNSGDVTFYGSFLIGGNPQIVYNSSLVIKENK